MTKDKIYLDFEAAPDWDESIRFEVPQDWNGTYLVGINGKLKAIEVENGKVIKERPWNYEKHN